MGHRDILGALMALGIERETTGDIIADGVSAARVPVYMSNGKGGGISLLDGYSINKVVFPLK